MPSRVPEDIKQRIRDEYEAERAERSVERGFCFCGCGHKTPITESTYIAARLLKGEPQRYLTGHQRRKSAVAYKVVDTGYSTPCWIWQRGLTPAGYGVIGRQNIRRYAHRIYFENTFGSIPSGLQLDHLCEQKACCNPDHLEAVTGKVNVRRGRWAKLNVEQVAEIKSLLRSTNYTQREIGDMFHVTPACISSIARGYNWQDVH